MHVHEMGLLMLHDMYTRLWDVFVKKDFPYKSVLLAHEWVGMSIRKPIGVLRWFVSVEIEALAALV